MEIGLIVEGAGADWGFVADTRDILTDPYIDFYTGAQETDDRPGFRISFRGSVYRGERGNGIRLSTSTTSVGSAANIAITGPRYEAASNRHILYILTKAGVALNLNAVVAALNAVAGVSAALINGATGTEAYDISRTYAQEYGTQEAVAGAPVSHGGTHEPLTPVVDETAKTYTLPYDVEIDDLNAIVAAINATDQAEATLTHGATGTSAPEAAGFTRSFEGRRGHRGRQGLPGPDPEPRRKVRVSPSGNNNRTLQMPADYATYDFVFIEWADGQSAEISLDIENLPSTGNRVYRSGGSRRLTWTASSRQFTLDGSSFTGATLYGIGTPGATAKDDQTAAEIAAVLDAFIGDAEWRSRLSGADLVAAVDAATGGNVWRTAHTALRTAAQVRDLLDGLLGTSWRTGGGSGTALTEAQILAATKYETIDLGAADYLAFNKGDYP